METNLSLMRVASKKPLVEWKLIKSAMGHLQGSLLELLQIIVVASEANNNQLMQRLHNKGLASE